MSIPFLGHSYTYTEISGVCEFSNPSHDYSYYDYEYHYDYDFAEEDKEQCLQSCLQKSKMIDYAVGCYFEKSSGQCIFLKAGTIVGASGLSDAGTCWRFDLGKIHHNMDCTNRQVIFQVFSILKLI